MKNFFKGISKVRDGELFDMLTSDRYFNKDKEEHICCLCGDVFYGYGNNPAPLARSSKRCCDMCNMTKVIPARLRG